MKVVNSGGGDSGGPWYWGGTAYGIHYGVSTGYDGYARNLFSQTRYSDEALGVYVRY
mgnify:FL=1